MPTRPAGERLAWVLLALVVVGVALIRWRVLDVPLERDEGEFAYAGQLLLQGIPPYKLLYNMKLPGTYLAYAALMAVFGQSIAGVHLGLLVVNAAATLLVFRLARRLFDPLASAFAGASYALLSLGSPVLGMAAHATQFVVPFACGALLVLLRDHGAGGSRHQWPRLGGAGVLLGCAILAKQPGGAFLLPALWLAVRPLDGAMTTAREAVRRCGWLLAGTVVPLLATAAWLAASGVFPRFWFWTFTYARAYGGEESLASGLTNFADNGGALVAGAPLLWAVIALGVIAVAVGLADRRRTFVLVIATAAFVAVCPGLYFREHYFVLFLPAAALFAGGALHVSMQRWPRARGAFVLVGVLALLQLAWSERWPFFLASPSEISRVTYPGNPFRESIDVARYLDAHAARDARVAVIGSEPQLYFYARRHSATGYIYVYGPMENQPYAEEMQREMIREIEAAQPEYVVFVDVPTSWLRKTTSPPVLMDWAERYVPQHYDVVGIVDIPEDGQGAARFRWDADARHGDPDSSVFIEIGRRRRDSK